MTTTIFTATDGVHGRELWRTDGTASGTFMITDLAPGQNSYFSSTPPTNIDEPLFTSAVGRSFFVLDDRSHGQELWATDGTAAGTRLLRDINPGTGSSLISERTVVNGRLFFKAFDGSDGPELWTSDGTEAGTRIVADLAIGSGTSAPRFLTASGNDLVFIDHDGTASSAARFGVELWKSDGTAAGTRLLVNLTPGETSIAATFLKAVGGTYFVGLPGSSGTGRLVVTDGTLAGTATIALTSADGSTVTPQGNAVALSDKVYFLAASNGQFQLWVSNGTSAGTHAVANGGGLTSVTYFTSANDRLYFTSGGEVWTADGDGAHIVKDITPGANGSDPRMLTEYNGQLYFVATDPTNGSQLWTTDGTEAGTHAAVSSNSLIPGNALGASGGALYLSANGGQGQEVWSTDGTSGGTAQVADVNASLNRTTNLLNTTNLVGNAPQSVVPGGVVFAAYDQAHGTEPWFSDGTVAGTTRISDVTPGLRSSLNPFFDPQRAIRFTQLGDKVVFVTADQNVWAADDVNFTGAQQLTAFDRSNLTSNNDPSPTIGLVKVGGTVFFGAYTKGIGSELWATDGTVGGTHLVKDIRPGGSTVDNLRSLGDKLLFTYSDSASNFSTNLWTTDGSEAGTQELRAGNNRVVGSFDGKVIFSGSDLDGSNPPSGYRLYVTDGTSAGTQSIGPSSSTLNTPAFGFGFSAPHGVLYPFDDGVHGTQVWATDGTAAGTQQITNLSSSAGSGGPAALSVIDDGHGRILFVSRTNLLFSTDLTAGGTQLLSSNFAATNLNVFGDQLYFTRGLGLWTSDLGGNNAHVFFPAASAGAQVSNGRLFFYGQDADNGVELWSSDGTQAGTIRVTDTYRNEDSTPLNFAPLLLPGDPTLATPRLALPRDTGLSNADRVTMDATLSVVATAPGATLHYRVDGVEVSSYDPAGLGQGPHTVTVTQTDVAGQTSAPGTISFTLDTVAPVNAIDTPPSETVVGVPTVIEGHGGAEDAGGRLDIVEGGTVLATTTVGSTGAWSTAVRLAEGAHRLTAILIDVAGNAGSASVEITAKASANSPPPPTGEPSPPADTPVATSPTSPPSEMPAPSSGAPTPSTDIPTPSTGVEQGSGTRPGTDVGQATPIGQGPGVNHAPVALGDALATAAHTVSGGAVLANDMDPDGDALHVASVRFAGGHDYAVPASGSVTVAGTHGALTIGTDGHYTYVASSAGGDAFAYTVSDGHGGVASARLDVTVAARAPAADTTFAFAFADAKLAFSGGEALLTGPDGVVNDVTGIGHLHFTDGTIDEADGAPLVDDLFYFAQNRDVWQAHIDPDQHYAQYGRHEGRDPNALFSTNGYLEANPDVRAAGIDPLQHYDQYGWHEGRSPGPGFSAEAYLAMNPDVKAAGGDPLAHYLAYGHAEGRTILPGESIATNGHHLYGAFDADFYLAINKDVAAAVVGHGDPGNFAFTHYLTYGAGEGRNPDSLFSTTGYLAANPDVAALGLNPLLHYEADGWQEGRNPSAAFSANGYLAANPDVAAAHVDPLQHYLQYGMAEARHGWEISV